MRFCDCICTLKCEKGLVKLMRSVRAKKNVAHRRRFGLLTVVLLVVLILLAVGVSLQARSKSDDGLDIVTKSFNEAVSIAPDLMDATGVKLNRDEKHDGNIMLGFVGCWGAVLQDGSVMLGECDQSEILYDADGLPYDMVQTPLRSELYLIIHPGLPKSWRGGVITLIPNREGDDSWFYIGVGMETANHEYTSALWRWLPEVQTYAPVVGETDAMGSMPI